MNDHNTRNLHTFPNCAISYIPEAYGIKGKNIVGRQSAGLEFLKAYIQYSGYDDFLCMTHSSDDFYIFQDQIKILRDKEFTSYHIDTHDIYGLGHIGTVYWPDPVINRLAWIRQAWNSHAYSLCGITHTLSDIEVIQAIQDMLIAPIESWDALVCTSNAAQKTVQAIFNDWSDYINDKHGYSPKPSLQTPVIPIGVDLDKFARTDAKVRSGKKLRQKLNIPDDAIVGLYFGRLNFLTKSHPTPMFLAFEMAAKQLENTQLHLLVVGQFNNPMLQAEFEDLEKKLCKKTIVHWLDGNDPSVTEACWHSAEFFISLSDNMQETFGMTVTEALAASLPCIVSDWSGIRENMVHGETGFLIPTIMPSDKVGDTFIKRSIFHIDKFSDAVASLNQVISTDIHECASAIVRVSTDINIRAEMRIKSRKFAERKFGWQNIIRQYQLLWKELADRRHKYNMNQKESNNIYHKGHINPFVAFEKYSSQHITVNSCIMSTTDLAPISLEELWGNISHLILSSMMLSYSDIQSLLSALTSNQSTSIEDILSMNPNFQLEKTIYTIAWLLKYGLIEIKGDEPRDTP